ncbi:MAG: tail fiber domain-containing protein [Patescibacteria group bacterium]
MKSAKQRSHILRRISRKDRVAQTLKRIGIGSFLVLLTLTAILYTRVGGDARVYAATSSNLNFQARLLNASGGLVPDGTYNIEFKLYDTLAAGASAQGVCVGGATDDCLWVETRTGANKVTVKNGYFSVNLASITGFPALNWDQDMWLTMNIGGTGAPSYDGEMSPRIKLTAVPYAFDSGQLDGIDSTGFAQLAPSSVQVINAALAALRLNQTGAGLLAQWQGDGADVFTVSKTGAVTAGTYNTNTFTGTSLTFGGAGATTIQAANNQGLTVQSQGSGSLTLDSASGTLVLGAATTTLQKSATAFTFDLNNASNSTFSITNAAAGLASLDVESGITAGNANAFSVSNDGDITSVFTALNGTSTANGAAPLGSTSLILTSAANFDVGNYVQMNSNNCGGTGINPCYAKITAKGGAGNNTLTITPSLVWANGSTVNEYHIPEVGGLNTSQALANRYGRGYFIAGVAIGNGTTFYNEDSIESSLTSFDLLNSGVTTLNIGGAATTINLGTAGTNLIMPGTLNVQGASLNIGTASQQGSLVLQNGDSKTGTIQAGTLSANRTYTLPDVSGTICLTTTCTGGGGGPVDAFIQDGNSFGVNATLGTNDNYGLVFETNGTQKVLIDAGGNVGIGTSGTPGQLLSIGGTTGNFTVSSSGAVVAVGLTSSSGLSVTAGGASITGGLNNNSGGITNAGDITGVGTNITANAGLIIASGGTSDLTLSSASGLLVLTAGTIQTLDNLAFDLAKATDTTLTLQNSGTGIVNLNLLDGGLSTGGTLRVSNTGTLQNITGLTVISGGASITGNITLGGSSSDRLTLTAQLGGASPLVFQGATDNGFATTLGIQDPTANNTVTLPNASGTLVLDSRSITTAAGSGLSGGGDLSVDRSLSLDINGLTTSTAIANDDYVAIYDSSATGIRKISRSDFLQGIIGALIYQGTWDASTNTPTLTDATGTNGYMYAVSVAGSENFGGGPSITFGVGDFVIHNGTDWEKAPSSANVTSVFGRTGAVTAQNGDYTGLQITNTPSGTIAATTVQAAINELATEKLGSLNGLTAITQTFANDTNVTISSSGSTHTLGWSGLLAVGRGGTGASTFTTNGVVFGNGTGALQVTAAGTGGQVLLANGSGVPTFTSLSGDITVSSTGVTAIGANTINLTTDTIGNYVASLGTVTGLTIGGTNGVEGAIPTLAVNYGSAANTAVQGNTTITVTAGTNLGGGGTITLGTGGTVTLNTIASPTFTTVTASTFTSAAGLTVSSGGTGALTLDSASNVLLIAGTDTGMERTAAGSYTIDLKDNATTSLVLSNSSAGGSSFANLNLADGELQIAGTTVIGSDRSLQNIAGLTNVGAFTTSGGIASLNAASNFDTNINTGSSTGTVTIGGGSAPLIINSTNFDVSSAGALSGITTINTSGLITSVGLTAGTGLVQGTGGLTFTGALSLNASAGTSTTNIGTGTTTGQISIGGGSTPLVINSTAFDVSSAGALSGITTISLSGAITGATATNTINGLIINAGSLSGITGYSQTSGAFGISGSGAITVGGGSNTFAVASTGIDISANAISDANTITSVNNTNLTLNANGTGSLVFTGYDCSGQSNGGALTTNASGVVACSADDSGISDARLKENVTSLNDDILSKIKDVRTVNFDFDCDQEFFKQRVLDCLTTRQTGVIAQELAQVFPELVYQAEDGYYRVKYDALNIYTLKAVTQLATKVEASSTATTENGVSTGGQLRLTSTGELQNIHGLQMVSGGASIAGGIDNNSGGIMEAGVIGGATIIDAQSIRLAATGTDDLLTLTKDGQGVFTVFNNGSLQLKLDAANVFNVKNATGLSIFNIDSLNGRVSIGNGDAAKTVLFTLDNRALPDDPPGTNGSSYYNTVFQRFRCYENNTWRDCLPAGDLTEPIAFDKTDWLQPETDQEFPGMPRLTSDLRMAHEYRLRIRVTSASASGASCRLQYASSDNGPWKNLSANSPGELSLAEAGTLKTDWLKIADEARKEDSIIRVMCMGGDGRSVVFYGVSMQVR